MEGGSFTFVPDPALSNSKTTEEVETSLESSESSTSTPSPSETAADPKNLLERWEDNHVKLLISCYAEHKHLFGKGKSTKREIFQKIAFAFNEKSSIKVSGDQALRKWAKLENKFKEVEDHNKVTGNSKKTMKFYDEINDCIGGNTKVKPKLTIESNKSQQNENVESDSNEGNSSENEIPSRPKRKRKSNSSAAEMLSFLQVYSEKREKAEEEKLQVLKEMKEERKEFFTQLIKVIKDK